MSQEESYFLIPKENKPKALEAIKALGKTGKDFSWVYTEKFVDSKTLEEALTEWRWDSELDNDSNIIDIQFSGEKLGDDLLLFETIAPFVKSQSYITMRGEDGTLWRWWFINGSVKEVTAKIVWEEYL
jgi:hypothetical protein